MLTYFENLRRVCDGMYKVQSWYLFGCILVFRRWTQLTTTMALPSER